MKRKLKCMIILEVLVITAILSILVVSASPQPDRSAVADINIAAATDTDTDAGRNMAAATDADTGINAAAATDADADINAAADTEIETETNEAAETVQFSGYPNGVLDTTDAFTDRDLEQTPSLEDALYYTVTSGEDIHITQEGTYVLTGTAEDTTIYVETEAEARVQLVLDGLSVTNQDFPCIYVTGADKVLVTTLGDSALTVTGTFRSDGETQTDGVIFARSDLVLNGTASLTIRSTDNGVVSKDDLKVTGGTYEITASSKALEANDSIRIAGGTLYLEAGTDGLHAENDEDDSLGYVYIYDGNLTIQAGDDGIHGTSVVQIDGGTILAEAAEGIEGTCIQINGGTIGISSWDDGINAANKSSAYVTGIEINGGEISVAMGAGDTDGIDTNGNLTINGGTVSVTGNSTFDCDGNVAFNAGTVIVNGQQVTSIPNQGGMGGMGGSRGGSRGGW